MYGGLRMYGDPDRGRSQVKQTTGLDDFQALVEQGGRIDGDSPAHDPGWVPQRLLDGDMLKLLRWELTERTARGGQPDTANFLCGPSPHALVNGVVLGINGE